jgi:hypothetical protein
MDFKTTMLVVGGLCALLFCFSAGSYALAKWVNQDALFVVGIVALLVFGLCFSAWRLSVLNERQERRKAHEAEMERITSRNAQ